MDFRSVCLLACLTIDVFFAICTDDAKFATEKHFGRASDLVSQGRGGQVWVERGDISKI